MILSVIVPAFNCEKYISDCLNSLTRQGFDDNYEVLVIDDGSTDSTPDIVKGYCDIYRYIKLINKENGGVSSARNLGIKEAKGKYIAFVDSDDYVTSNLYLPIIEIIENNNLSAMYYGYSTSKETIEMFNNSFFIVKKENACKGAVWRYVFSRNIIVDHSLMFDETITYAEDLVFNYKYIQLCDKPVAGSAQCLYYYRLHDNQATYWINNKDGNHLRTYYDCYLLNCVDVKKWRGGTTIR